MPAEDRRILLISHDTVGRKMAGPGIRYYHLATVLARHFDLTLAVPCPPEQWNQPGAVDLSLAQGSVVPYVYGLWSTLESAVDWAEVIILPSDIAHDFPRLAELGRPLVVDGYDPLLIEWLALHGTEEVNNGGQNWQKRMQALQCQYTVGDFFICASERQRDWWLGLLEANGRINPWTFCADSSLRSLIDIVPYGLPNDPPRTTHRVIKGVWPGIGPDDRIILWGGGLWKWLDPLTAIRAVAQVWQQRQDVRLVFPGTRHPNPTLSAIPSHNEAARSLAAEVGLLDKAIFFGDWVPYEDWVGVLLESDVALSLHFDTIETRLAFRSRVLEYIWAGVPTITSRGDATSDLVARYDLGVVVDYGDVDGVAKSLLQLLETKPEHQASFAHARSELKWETVARPLLEFCRRPQLAADRIISGHQIGNPAWVQQREQLTAEVGGLAQQVAQLQHQVTQLEAENAHKADLIQCYEEGRFIRTMRWLHERKQTMQQMLNRTNR